MCKPVVVIHGVANRNKAEFTKLVKQFNLSINSNLDFLPVFWGDLAANEGIVQQALPNLDSSTIVRIARQASPDIGAALLTNSLEPSERQLKKQSDTIMQGALETLLLSEEPLSAVVSPVHRASRGSRAMAGHSAKIEAPKIEALQEAIREELPNTQYLQHIQNPEVLKLVGATIGKAISAQSWESDTPMVSGRTVDSPIQRTSRIGSTVTHIAVTGMARFKEFAKGIISDMDNMAGELMNTALGRVNSTLRGNVLGGFTRLVGDIFVYQRDQKKIQNRIWKAIRDYERRTNTNGWGTKERPIDVIAHSLGGVITFDAAVNGEPQLWVRRYITFGSQPAFFHLIDPRTGLKEYKDYPITLPPSIGAWTSFWEPMDLLAFLTKPVFLLNDGKTSPRDLQVRVLQSSELAASLFWTHSCYWTHDSVIKEIRNVLS